MQSYLEDYHKISSESYIMFFATHSGLTGGDEIRDLGYLQSQSCHPRLRTDGAWMRLLVKLIGTVHLAALSSTPRSTTTGCRVSNEDAKTQDAAVNHQEIELLGKKRDQKS